jgi:hypothetical protein
VLSIPCSEKPRLSAEGFQRGKRQRDQVGVPGLKTGLNTGFNANMCFSPCSCFGFPTSASRVCRWLCGCSGSFSSFVVLSCLCCDCPGFTCPYCCELLFLCFGRWSSRLAMQLGPCRAGSPTSATRHQLSANPSLAPVGIQTVRRVGQDLPHPRQAEISSATAWPRIFQVRAFRPCFH